MSSGSLYTGSAVKELTSKDFSGTQLKTTKGKEYYLMVYAPWCPHCVSKVDLWKFLGEQFNRLNLDGGRTVIAVINSEDPQSQEIVRALGVSGYPSFFKKSSKSAKFQRFSFNGMFNINSFVEEHCGVDQQCQKGLMKLCGLKPQFCNTE